MDNITASRNFEVYNENDVNIGTVHILIRTPVKDAGVGEDWNCRYQISGIDDDTIKNAYGVDSLQALLLCVRKIDAEVQYFQKVNKVELRWLGLKSLGLGID